MQIKLGPAGVPVSSTERTTEGGITKVKELGLNAMEIEFVRKVYMDEVKAKSVGDLARSLGVQLTVHAPYFINLLSEKKKTVEDSKKRIKRSLEVGEALGAKIVVVHAAYYGSLTKEEAMERMVGVTTELLDFIKEKGLKIKLAYETMAKKSQFAGLEELLELRDKVDKKRFTVLIDFAHLFVRNNGRIDYNEILEKAKELGHVYSHFSNVKYNVNTKKFLDIHVPINSHPPFKPLAEEIVKRKIDITIISESPLLEKDSLKMRKIFEEIGIKF